MKKPNVIHSTNNQHKLPELNWLLWMYLSVITSMRMDNICDCCASHILHVGAATWSSWTPWSRCERTCGYRTQTRSRKCIISSRQSPCRGRSFNTKSCNNFCPIRESNQFSRIVYLLKYVTKKSIFAVVEHTNFDFFDFWSQLGNMLNSEMLQSYIAPE